MSLYHRAKDFRERGQNREAYDLYKQRTEDSWEWAYELAVVAFYTVGKSALREILEVVQRVKRSNIPPSEINTFLANLVFYTQPLKMPSIPLNCPHIPTFNSSTPCVVTLPGYEAPVILVRYVDYTINSTRYHDFSLRPDRLIRTCYALRIGDTPWRLVTILDEGFKKIPDPIWKGIEDIRLFWDPATFKIRGLGTTYEYSTDNHGTIILLDVDLDTATITPMSLLPRRQDCEKNHSPILGTNLVVYGWWPAISVYDIREPGKFTHENREVPLIFNKMRGSTVGVPYPSRDTPVSYWFITHTKSDNAPWVFTSYIVILKAETFEVQSYSLPFFFENSHIEFTTGFTFVDDDSAMLIGYSVLDKSSAMMKLPISRVREMLIPVTTVHV